MVTTGQSFNKQLFGAKPRDLRNRKYESAGKLHNFEYSSVKDPEE
jgi:hypothetical protein